MLNQTGILQHYRPLQPFFPGDIYDKHPDYGDEHFPYLNEYDFIWQPHTDQRQVPQLFVDEALSFKPDDSCRGGDEAALLTARLKGQPLRMPAISRCWGRTLVYMLRDDLLDGIEFAPVLGITRTRATLNDATGTQHSGFSALCFHKALSPARAEKRLAQVAEEQRLLLPLHLAAQNNVILIHESLLQRWLQQGACLAQTFNEQCLDLAQLARNDFYYPSAGSQDYFSLDDYQHDRNARVWEG